MKELYQQWLDLHAKWREQEPGSLKPPEELSAELRKCVIAMLKLIAKDGAKMPPDVAYELAEAINALSSRQSETFLLPGNRLENRRQLVMHPFMESLRQDAVNYLGAVKRGDLLDDKPVHTVATAYGVNRSTVQDWREQLTAVDIPDFRQKIEEDADESIAPAASVAAEAVAAAPVVTKQYLFEVLMHASGKRYKRQKLGSKRKT